MVGENVKWNNHHTEQYEHLKKKTKTKKQKNLKILLPYDPEYTQGKP